MSLHLFYFVGELANWSESMPTYEISRNSSKKSQQNRNYQAVSFVVCLIIVHLNRKFICKLIPLIIRNADIDFIRIAPFIIPLGFNRSLQGINIMYTVFINKHCQASTYHCNTQCSDACKPPLQRHSFHRSDSSRILYPSPTLLIKGS